MFETSRGHLRHNSNHVQALRAIESVYQRRARATEHDARAEECHLGLRTDCHGCQSEECRASGMAVCFCEWRFAGTREMLVTELLELTLSCLLDCGNDDDELARLITGVTPSGFILVV